MRIALVPSAYAPAIGGVERVAQQLARHLQAAGDTVEVWTIHHPSTLAREEVVEGVRVRRLPCPLPAVDLHRLTSLPVAAARALGEWRCAVDAFAPEVLNVHCFSAQGVYATLAARREERPLVVTLHGETAADDRHLYQRSVVMRTGLRLGLRRAAAVTAPSRFVLDDVRRFGLAPEKATVIPNGVDLRPPDQPEPLDLPDGRYVVAVGRQVRNKGFDLLVAAFATLADRFPSTRLVLGGDGPERAALATMAAKADLADRIHLCGWLRPGQVHWLLDRAAVVVVPSRTESFGLTVLEGLRSRRPVVATTRGGVREFIEDGRHALLVDPTDVTALAGAVGRLLENPALARRLAAAGYDHVAGFGWSAVTQRYREAYRSVR